MRPADGTSPFYFGGCDACPWDFGMCGGRHLSIAETPFIGVFLGVTVALSHSVVERIFLLLPVPLSIDVKCNVEFMKLEMQRTQKIGKYTACIY